MEIITHGLINTFKIYGYVTIEVFHTEDVARMEPLHKEEGDNTIQSHLLNMIASDLRSSTANTNYNITQWPNVNSTSRCYPSFDGTDHDRDYTSGSSYINGADGIFCETATASPTGYTFPGSGVGDFTQALALGQGDDMTQGSSGNTFTIIGEATWLGKNVGAATLTSASSGNITNFELGKDFSCKSEVNSDFTYGHAGSNYLYANYTASAFSLDMNDQLKVTWTIQIT